MKKKWMVSTALLCSAALLVSGCGGKKADGFDAAGYTTAYLDGMIKDIKKLWERLNKKR